MRSLRRIIFSAAILLLVALFWSYRFEAAKFFRGGSETEFQSLRLENESLKFQLERLAGQATEATPGSVRAEVYSSYPFNDQAKIVINKGSSDGLREGLPVLAAPDILFGIITKVEDGLSEVQTVFDPAWRSSVGISPANVKALLIGGPTPVLDFIAKDSLPAAGATVVNLSPEYPYGLLIGRVGEVGNRETEPWATASLQVPYNLNALNEVLVLTATND